jgi:hypothetical protein
MLIDKKDQDENAKIPDDIKKILNLQGDDPKLNEQGTGIFDELLKDDDFDKEIEQILALLNEETMDLTKLQTQIILLIKKYLNNNKNYNIAKAKGHELKIDEKLIAKNITELSSYLMQQKSEVVKGANRNLSGPKDKYQGISKQSRSDLKNTIKTLAVYEVYKVLNPKKIAGETRKENFAHNMIIGGMDRAKHYAGGTQHEVATYSPTFLKKLENAHKSFKRGGREL